jgi:endonuclease YncB( thermonuclease family)
MLSTIFASLFLISLIGLTVGLIKPSAIRMSSRKSILIYLGGAMLLFFILVGVTAEPIKETESNTSYYLVTNVVDGDTIDVNINGEIKRIRLIGIDAPEVSENECYNNESFEKAKELLLNKKVSLEADSSQDDKDIYNRLLRYVFLEDGTNFNLYMIKDGYAIEYTYDKAYKYQNEFKAAQDSAKTGNKGLWNTSTCSGKIEIAQEEDSQPAPTIKQTSSPSQTKDTEAIQSSGSFGPCGSKTKCGQMISCEEAYFYLKTCGLTRLDGDKDGVPCESICL